MNFYLEAAYLAISRAEHSIYLAECAAIEGNDTLEAKYLVCAEYDEITAAESLALYRSYAGGNAQ